MILLGWGSVTDIKEEEKNEDVPMPKSRIIKNYPESKEQERPLKMSDTTDLTRSNGI